MGIPVKIKVAAVILLAAIIPACKKMELEKKQYYSGDESKTSEKAGEKPPVTPHIETLLSIQEAFISVAEKVTPSVVNISTVQHISGGRRPPFEVDPFSGISLVIFLGRFQLLRGRVRALVPGL